MKSVIQEASSLCKAIEQGWEKAGKPKEFCVRILQDAHKNFLGISTKNAKIALFFGKLDEQKQQLFKQPEIKKEHTAAQTQQQTQQQPPQQTQQYRPLHRQPHRRPHPRKLNTTKPSTQTEKPSPKDENNNNKNA
jgi:hypothetical protein